MKKCNLFPDRICKNQIAPDIDRISFDLSKSEEKVDELKEIYREMIRIRLALEEEYGHLLMNGLLYRFLYLLLTYFKIDCGSESVKSQKYIDRIRKVLDYIDVHYQESLTLQGVAEKFAVSMEYLSRVMKKYTGHTFKEHLNQIRLMKAFEQLMQTDYSVTEIAMNSGFSDVRSFISVFKENYGVAPLQFRKKNMKHMTVESGEMVGAMPHVRRIK